MGMTEAKIANHTHRTAELLEQLLAEQKRTNQLLEQILQRSAPTHPGLNVPR